MNTNYINLQFTMVHTWQLVWLEKWEISLFIWEVRYAMVIAPIFSVFKNWNSKLWIREEQLRQWNKQKLLSSPLLRKILRKTIKIGMSCESSEVNILCQVEVAGKHLFGIWDPMTGLDWIWIGLWMVSKFPLLECYETEVGMPIDNNWCILSWEIYTLSMCFK